MLIENTLFGEVNKVQEAIDLIKEHEPPNGYYVCFSGGKDSIVIYDLCKKANVKFTVHYNVTTVDPPELIYFIRKYYPEVWENRNTPKMTMWQLVEKKVIFPTRRFRYCCAVLKEQGGKGYDVVTGVRAEESSRRAKRKQYEQKNDDKNNYYCHPIFYWTSDDVWEYIRSNDLPYCKLYDEGYDRIGCILCPYQSGWKFERDMKRYPKYVENYIKAADRGIKRRIREKEKATPPWKDGQEMFEWWRKGMHKTTIAASCDSVPLFSEDDGSVL